MTRKVLILCTGNACRSQMAEGLWRTLGKGAWEVASAGSKPAGFVHPMAVAVMAERGIDISSHRSKGIDEFVDQPFDLVVTVCDHAREACPVFPQVAQTLHWPFDDPYFAEGSEEDQLIEFRRVRDEIESAIHNWLVENRITASDA